MDSSKLVSSPKTDKVRVPEYVPLHKVRFFELAGGEGGHSSAGRVPNSQEVHTCAACTIQSGDNDLTPRNFCPKEYERQEPDDPLYPDHAAFTPPVSPKSLSKDHESAVFKRSRQMSTHGNLQVSGQLAGCNEHVPTQQTISLANVGSIDYFKKISEDEESFILERHSGHRKLNTMERAALHLEKFSNSPQLSENEQVHTSAATVNRLQQLQDGDPLNLPPQTATFQELGRPQGLREWNPEQIDDRWALTSEEVRKLCGLQARSTQTDSFSIETTSAKPISGKFTPSTEDFKPSLFNLQPRPHGAHNSQVGSKSERTENSMVSLAPKATSEFGNEPSEALEPHRFRQSLRNLIVQRELGRLPQTLPGSTRLIRGQMYQEVFGVDGPFKYGIAGGRMLVKVDGNVMTYDDMYRNIVQQIDDVAERIISLSTERLGRPLPISLQYMDLNEDTSDVKVRGNNNQQSSQISNVPVDEDDRSKSEQNSLSSANEAKWQGEQDLPSFARRGLLKASSPASTRQSQPSSPRVGPSQYQSSLASATPWTPTSASFNPIQPLSRPLNSYGQQSSALQAYGSAQNNQFAQHYHGLPQWTQWQPPFQTTSSSYVHPYLPVDRVVRPPAPNRMAPLYAQSSAFPPSMNPANLPPSGVDNHMEWYNRFGTQLQPPPITRDIAILPFRSGADDMYPRPTGAASIRLQNLTRSDPPNFAVAVDDFYLPFGETTKMSKTASWGVLKIGNIPYDVTSLSIKTFLGNHAKLITPDLGPSIHIIMERATGKTQDAFVEFFSIPDAKAWIDVIRSRQPHLNKIGDRILEVELSSQAGLLKEIFPRAKSVNWNGGSTCTEVVAEAPQDPYDTGFKGFVTIEELQALVRHAEQPHRSAYTGKCMHRPYTTIISLLSKFPWQAIGLYTLATRNAIFSTTIGMIRSLVALIRRGREMPQNLLMNTSGSSTSVSIAHNISNGQWPYQAMGPSMLPFGPTSFNSQSNSFGHNRPPSNGVDEQLLRDVVMAGLNAYGFSDKQRWQILEASASILGRQVFRMSPIARGWPFETLGRKCGYEEDVVEFYAHLLSNHPNVAAWTRQVSSIIPSPAHPFGNLGPFFSSIDLEHTTLEMMIKQEKKLLRRLIEDTCAPKLDQIKMTSNVNDETSKEGKAKSENDEIPSESLKTTAVPTVTDDEEDGDGESGGVKLNA